jgi:hypothetical protein
LCEDGVWGVRKACADVFMPVSCVCTQFVRRTELAPLFINLVPIFILFFFCRQYFQSLTPHQPGADFVNLPLQMKSFGISFF